MMYKNLLLIFLFIGCEYNFPEVEEPTDRFTGTDFTQMIFVGGTFSSGVMDGTLSMQSQQFSFPAIIGEKLNRYEEEAFSQIPVYSDLGFNVLESDIDKPIGKFKLQYLDIDAFFPSRVSLPGEVPGDLSGDISDITDFSIPGILLTDLNKFDNTGDNFYLNRLPLSAGESITKNLSERKPEIIIFCLGFDEFFHEAFLGLNDRQKVDLLPENLINEMEELISQFSVNDETDIFLINLPNLVHSPYFSTLPFFFKLGNEISIFQVSEFASYYSQFNEMVFQYNFIENRGVSVDKRRPFIDFDIDGPERFRAKVIIDDSLPAVILNDGTEIPKYRQLTDGEYLLYSAEKMIAESVDFGSVNPIDNRFYLSLNQIEFIENKIREFNQGLKRLSESKSNIHLIDVFAHLEEIRDERFIHQGVIFNTRFQRNSIYSSDGYNLNEAGNAMIANLLIDALNETIGSGIRRVNVHDYPSLSFYYTD